MNRRIIISLLLALTGFYNIPAQTGVKITYKYLFNGNEMPDMPKLILTYRNEIAKIASAPDDTSSHYEETNFLDFNSRKAYQVVKFRDGRVYTVITSFDEYPMPELTDDYTEILGYRCRKAKVIIRSNNIDIWFLENSHLKGTPLLNQGTGLGLVLKIVRNGNFVVEVQSIDTAFNDEVNLPGQYGEIVDLPAYREMITESNYTSVQVFSDERINFDNTLPVNDAVDENVTYRYSNGTIILKRIKLPENIWDCTIIAELSTFSDGDAYDRTGSLFVIPAGKKISFLDALKSGKEVLPEYRAKNGKTYRGAAVNKEYSPPTEIMRFITPFGIKKYNEQVTVKGIKWEDSVVYRQDVTDLAAVLQGEVFIGAFIGNYDKGGHILSLKLKYFLNDINSKEIKKKKYFIQPVFNTVNVLESSGGEYGTMFETDTLTVNVDIPEGLKSLKLRYISTGHGGWDGGDEFNPRLNEIFIDGRKYFSYIPWRTDCGMYRKYNPASGNFPNGMSSSDFSRSGWCPGSISNPEDIPLTGLSAGTHTIGVYIPIGKPEGSSFSSWNVSAVLIGEYK